MCPRATSTNFFPFLTFDIWIIFLDTGGAPWLEDQPVAKPLPVRTNTEIK
jgi:hypothetical protein